MVFLFQDQNQGTRNDTAPRQRAEQSQPFSFIRTLTVGFGITPNLLTLPQGLRKALAGLGYVTLTAGGDFHPALRTSAARDGRPSPNMTKGRGVSKRLSWLESACPHADGTGQRGISGWRGAPNFRV